MATARSQQPAEEPAEEVDPRDARIAELERRLAEAQRPRQAFADQASMRLKVEPPHAALHHAGLVVGNEFTEVPGNRVAAFMEAAADAGVTITQDLES
jgi:hypothetical protein